MTEFALESQEPAALEPGIRITEWSQMVGRTVRAVIEELDCLSQNVKAIIVFEDDSWATLVATSNDSFCADEGAILDLVSYYGGKATPISEYAHPDELLAARLINSGQHALLMQRRKDEVYRIKAQRLALLKDEIKRMEGKG